MEEDEVVTFGTKIIDNASSDLHPVAEILDNLKNDDLALRLGALKRLTTIALALGPDRTTNDLVPFLGALAADEEDEVLLVLGEELPKLVGFGQDGVKSAHVLLPVLETLLQAEETVVRQQAVVATQRVMEALETAVQVEEHLWPLWIRLAQGSFFISKASAATLAADVYARLSTGSMRQELRRLFATQVCLDECPIVRRAAAPTLARLVLLDGKNGERMETDADGATSTAHVLMEEWWPLFTALAGDAQDSVRLLAVETALAFGDALPAKTTHDLLLPVVFRLAGDRSWRVRYLVGASFTGLMERVFLSAGSTALDPLAIFTALLGDAEAEVRTAAARQLATTCAHFSQTDFERKVLPVLRTLATDPSMPVRAAVATQLNPLSAIAGAELAASALFPLYTHFFADESSQVRLNAVSKMDVVCQVMGIDKLSQSILPAIVHLAEDKQWRVREAVIEHLPTLTSHLGETFFDDNLARICLALLEDPVHQVRQSAISNVRALVDRFGMVWCGERLLQPAVSRLVANGSYLRRTGVVRLIAVLAPVADDAVFASLALPALKTLAADAVPNVRLCVARAIGDLALLVQTRASLAGMARELVPLLQKLVQDADGDVQFYATRALSVA